MRVSEKTDIILTVSQTIKNEIVNEHGVDPEKIIVTTIPPADFFSVKNETNVIEYYDIKTKKYIYTINKTEDGLFNLQRSLMILQ